MRFDSRVVLHAGWEMLLMRVAFAWLVWSSTPQFLPYHSQPHPNSIAHILDLTFLANVDALGPLRGVIFAALVFYVIGIAVFPALSIICAMQIAWGSFENSQGAINHSFQPLALAALAQWGTAGYFAISRILRKAPLTALSTTEIQRYMIHAAKVALISCYVTSSVTKLERTGGEWVLRTPNLAAAIKKTNASHYLNSFHHTSPLSEAAPELIVRHPNLARLFFGGGLLLEFFAFLALLGRWPAVAIGTSLIAMHEAIAVIMHLHFPVFQWLSIVFLVNVPYLIFLAGKSIWRVRNSRSTSPAAC